MDYESLYKEYQYIEKNLKDQIKGLAKLQKSIAKGMESGELAKSRSDLAQLQSVNETTIESIDGLRGVLLGFDSREYIESGLFASQLLEQCREAGIDVIGEFPVYEMFPYRVRISVEEEAVYLDRKKYALLRPKSLVALIKRSQEKLYKASFNAASFANELAAAYDLAELANPKKAGGDVYLTTLYKFLVPMARSRKEYDQQSYAFDIARLFDSEEVELKGGRRYQFGPSRNNNKALRILDREGREHYLATIRFF
ncbi:MAG: hypothetical protein RBS49_07985 [Sphaerochaeta sp.]|jgi:hypothetical protein|nr:hypothetical protein [Sphaerochaeta sp.]MDX9915820.1 hypothetical protein [Sphaerochaeta sp.]